MHISIQYEHWSEKLSKIVCPNNKEEYAYIYIYIIFFNLKV